MRPAMCGLMHRLRRARGANQPIGFLQHVVVLRLLAREKTDGHEQRTEYQAHQHDLAVGAPVGIVK
jgi:hypothetical protein